MQSNLLPPKNVLSLLHFKKAGKYFVFMTVGENAASLPSSFIKKTMKNVKIDHYSSPSIGQKTKGRGKSVTFQN